MDFVDLRTQQEKIKEYLDANMQRVLAHGHYIMGPEIEELEEKLANYVGVKHAISCASGTDALLMALMALRIGPGDAVFTTCFTFIATAEVISLLGATPVFVDIDPATFNIDPAKLNLAIQAVKANDHSLHPLPKFKANITSPPAGEGQCDGGFVRPRAIIPVDLYGLPADITAIDAIAKKYGLAIIEDAAQSLGAEYRGVKACALGEIGCTSFFPSKPLGCYGDGGMCFTEDDSLASILRSLRLHGQGSHKYDNVRIGMNGRLDTLQAAILLAKLEIFSEEIELRQQVAKRYSSLMESVAGIVIPRVPAESKSAWAQYSILAQDRTNRAALMDKLKAADIPTAIYYPKPLHLQEAFAGLGYRTGDFPVSEDCANRIFSLPMHPYLSLQDQETISRILNKG